MTTSLSHSLSSTGSLSTVREQQIRAKKDRSATITHENSDNSLANTFKAGVEPTRFPSLTFISQNIANNDRETSIKNANLRSELIENNKVNKKSKDALFNNIPTVASVSSPTTTTFATSFQPSTNSQIPKGGSINTLQTVYTDAYSSLDFDDLKSNNNGSSNYNNLNDGLRILSPGEFHPRDDAHSAYQQSIYSNNFESHFPNPPYQKVNNNHTTGVHQQNTNNYNSCGTKEGSESFIYNDLNSMDIMSLSDQKLQRKLSNGIFLSNPMTKENYPNIPNQNLINSTSNNIAGNGATSQNDLDFLDNQSISTVVTSSDVQSYMNSGKRSPATKRQLYYPSNNLSVSPTYSKVRQVSQKIFNNYNNNNNAATNSNTATGPIGYTKIDLSKRFRNNVDNEFFENVDEFPSHELDRDILEEDLVDKDNDKDNDQGDEDDINLNLNELDEHTGLTDAESYLAKPYKKRNNFKGRYHSKISPIEQSMFDHMARGNIKRNRSHVNSPNKAHVENLKKGHQRMNMKMNKPRYEIYGSIKHPYYDSLDEYNVQDGPPNDENSPHDYKSLYYRQNMFLKFILSSIYIFVLLLMLCTCLKIIIMKNFNNTLVDFEVADLENVLVSDEILLLDIKSRASNTNLQDISIWDLGLDLFLVTDESNLMEEGGKEGVEDGTTELVLPGKKEITILLGNSNKFLTPLKFIGLLNLPTWSEVWHKWKDPSQVLPTFSGAQLKLYQPGKGFVYQGEELSHDQWLRILNSKYKIILRGNLKYSLPLVWQDQFISISTEIEIKPKI